MENSSVAGTLTYLLISALGLSASRALSRYCSGPRAITKWYYVSLAFSIAGCAAHWSVFKEGKILFYDQPGAIFKTSGAIRWIALASALLQACCIPTSKEAKPRRRWGKLDPHLPSLQFYSRGSNCNGRARRTLLALKVSLAVCLLTLTVATLTLGYYLSVQDDETKTTFFVKRALTFRVEFENIFANEADDKPLPELRPDERDAVIGYCKYRLGIVTNLQTQAELDACRLR